jgi:SAM-dependent methyltransferase
VEGDRERWNAKWRERAGELETQAAALTEHAALLPSRGKALDVAGGAGRNAIWLARRGLDVTLVDISDVALAKAERRATTTGLAAHMRFLRVDLDGELPLAPLFDLVLVFHYLNRARRDGYAALLVDGGVLVAAQPTVTNLERHASPRRDFLVEPGELESWARELGMEILASHEGWTDDGRHEALVIARRVPRAPERSAPEESGPAQGPYR